MNSSMKLSIVISICSALSWGCSQDRERLAPAETPSAASPSSTELAPGGKPSEAKIDGSVSGKVTYKGSWQPRSVSVSRDQEVCGKEKTDPSLIVSTDGGVQNAVVYIKGVQNGKKIEPAKVTLDQKGCEYRPHVLAIPASSTVEILNPDGILHNVHTQSKINAPFNMAQPKFKTTMEVKIDKPEIVLVKCDVHPWMSGWIFVAESPYYNVTDSSGGFSLVDVPPGKYVVELWHEKLGTQSKEVQIEGNTNAEINFEFAGPVS